jgi:hypothetical protein
MGRLASSAKDGTNDARASNATAVTREQFRTAVTTSAAQLRAYLVTYITFCRSSRQVCRSRTHLTRHLLKFLHAQGSYGPRGR